MPADAVFMEVSGEWMAACEVQQRFMRLSGPMSGCLDYSARCRQAFELGGDFYDFVPLPNNRLALAVGDASGKGLAAALMISNVQSSLRTAALFAGDNVAAVVEAVNRQVFGSSLANRYATLFYGVFDRATRTLRYVNAGHPPPMVIRPDGSVDWLETGGAPIGMFPDWSYEQGELRLDPGEIVVACTDGIVESVNPAGEEWGVEGLWRAATESADQIVQSIISAVDKFTGGCQTDDLAAAVLRVT